MYSISEVAKLTNLTARTLRHYEDKGLIECSRRAQNGYRYYSKNIVSIIDQIKKYKKMEFSLDEIKPFLDIESADLENTLNFKLNNKIVLIDEEIQRLTKSKKEVQDQLLATNSFFNGKTLAKSQRRVLMETFKREVLENLKLKKTVSFKDLEYLKREDYLFNTPEKRDFIKAVRKCIKFAEDESIKLGKVRGAAPGILSLFALGISDFDPSDSNLVPERFDAVNFCLHIDVEFKNGQKFIDYCKGISVGLKLGSIEAFKLPILDIIDNVNLRLKTPIDFDLVDYNDPLILNLFRNGDIERVFSFDFPANTLMAKHMDGNYYKNGLATGMLANYLRSQTIKDFSDLLNIEAIFRPDNLDKKPFFKTYIDRYPEAKRNGYYYDCLSSSLNEYLKPNYGVIIYQEDIIEIIREYTSWSYEKCNEYRRALAFGKISDVEIEELTEFTGKEVYNLLAQESPVVFCKAHSLGAWPKLIKASALLKAKHKEIYYEEIDLWEAENGYSWGDFGFIQNGVSLLQQ